MRCTIRTAGVLALSLLALSALDASAGWNNVFQTTCCGHSSRSSYFAPPAPEPCCPSVSYVQRCHYVPVTTYKQESYMEPVTTYSRSYYWEPVTRYRYTSYYDPCTGCAQNVATPYTSHYLRSRCNAVQSYVQRCRMVPVTEMRKSYYLEPVVSYAGGCDQPAGIRQGPPTAIGESSDRIMPRGAEIDESAEPKRIPSPKITPESRRLTPVPATPIRADRVAGLSDQGRLRGHVVRDDRITPRAGATIRFIDENAGEEIIAKSDSTGRFAIDLPAGQWTMYLPTREGKSEFHSTLTIRKTDDRQVMVVSR